MLYAILKPIAVALMRLLAPHVRRAVAIVPRAVGVDRLGIAQVAEPPGEIDLVDPVVGHVAAAIAPQEPPLLAQRPPDAGLPDTAPERRHLLRNLPHRREHTIELDLPSTAGPVAIADAEGNGVAQIIVGCGDGHVYGIGHPTTKSR